MTFVTFIRSAPTLAAGGCSLVCNPQGGDAKKYAQATSDRTINSDVFGMEAE